MAKKEACICFIQKETPLIEEKTALKGVSKLCERGKTYEPDISTAEINPSDIEALPGKRDFTSGKNIAVFDLETTRLFRKSDIIQLAAFGWKEELNIYISPSQEIMKTSSEITEIENDFESRCMFS